MRFFPIQSPCALFVLSVLAAHCAVAPAAPKKGAEPVLLSAEGQALLAGYEKSLAELRTRLTAKLPAIDPALEAAFLKAHADEGPQFQKQAADSKKKPQQRRDSGVYKDFKREKVTLGKARPILSQLDGLLGSDALDADLTRCAVLAAATPRGLAEFAQQSPAHKALIDALLADSALMKQMLLAGGAKAGRYGRAMEILRDIRAASPRSTEGILGRLALATALELAASELCGYEKIDPVKRYFAYETWYLQKQLDPAFESMTVWECRHIINDSSSEEDLAWLRAMVRNYRPDCVDTTYPRDKYMAVNGDIPQTTPEYEEDLSNLQAICNAGGRCGPKAGLGRATTRAFGIPTWGTRVKAHTGMTCWTPHGWTTALGVAWTDSFWNNDKPETMVSVVFRLDQLARENPDEYVKAARCSWLGDALGQERINGMVSGRGGLWHALALNKKRAIATDAFPNYDGKRQPWAEDTYALIPDFEKRPEKSSPLVTPAITPDDRRIDVSSAGEITVPAAACVAPTASTGKIRFMKSTDGGIQLHYGRSGEPEPFTYEINTPQAGEYLLCAKVVTINRDQSMKLTLNDQQEAINVPLPYTRGMWEQSQPVKLSLVKGKNTLTFTRSIPDEFHKRVWTNSGPDFGGVSIRQFTLTVRGGSHP